MTKYICLKVLPLEKYGEDGELLEEIIAIEEGTVWEVVETAYNMVVSKEGIRLIGTGAAEGQWIEIYPDTLSEHFIELELQEKFNKLTSKYGYDRGVLIYHGHSIEEVLAYTDEDAEAAVEAMSSFT